LPLYEKVRIEIFIPDPPAVGYRNLLEELATELSYAAGARKSQSQVNTSPSMVVFLQTKLISSSLIFRFGGRKIDFTLDNTLIG
jgi:hypothetical protein